MGRYGETDKPPTKRQRPTDERLTKPPSPQAARITAVSARHAAAADSSWLRHKSTAQNKTRVNGSPSTRVPLRTESCEKVRAFSFPSRS
jgi:hypothetical protein